MIDFCANLLTFESNRIEAEDTESVPSNFDRIRGSDSWLGRHVEKSFGSLGKFKGRVDGADDDEANAGHRIFHVTYRDGDEEWMAVEELADILLPANFTVLFYFDLIKSFIVWYVVVNRKRIICKKFGKKVVHEKGKKEQRRASTSTQTTPLLQQTQSIFCSTWRHQAVKETGIALLRSRS